MHKASSLGALVFAVVLMAASTALCREKIQEATAVDSPAIERVSASQVAEPIQTIEVIVPPLQEIERLAKIRYAEVLALISAYGITEVQLKDVLITAYRANIDSAVMVDIFKVGIANGLSPLRIADIVSLAISAGLPDTTVPTVVASLASSVVEGIPINSIAALMLASHIEGNVSFGELSEVFRIAASRLSDIAALVAVKKNIASRWDILTPSAFSTLWYVKKRGKAAEERGDAKCAEEQWLLYWKIFSKARK